MNNTFIEAVAVGVVPSQNNRMIRATFEYSGGGKLTLEGDALYSWLSGYIHLIDVYSQSHSQPAIQSEKLRDLLRGKLAPKDD